MKKGMILNGTRYFADASEGLMKLRKSMYQVIRKLLSYLKRL